MHKHLPYALQETPFEFLIGVFCVVAGPVNALNLTAPHSIDSFLPDWARAIWGACLFVSGILIIVGRIIRRGELIEQAGMGLLASASSVHAFALLSLLDPRSFTTAFLYLVVAAACAIRWRVLTKFHDAMKERREDDL